MGPERGTRAIAKEGDHLFVVGGEIRFIEMDTVEFELCYLFKGMSIGRFETIQYLIEGEFEWVSNLLNRKEE